MSEIKTVLANIGGTSGDKGVLDTSFHLARLFDAHLHCVHTVPDRSALLGRAVNVDFTSEMLLTDAMRMLQAEADKRLKRAREDFAAFCRDEHVAQGGAMILSPSASWQELSGRPVEVLIGQARFHDVVVVEGGKARDLILSHDDLGRLIIAAGRPVLLARPLAGGTAYRRMAVAWKNCPEAARALTAAMPLLLKAESVVVLNASEAEAPTEGATDLERIVNYLRGHRLAAYGHQIKAPERSQPDAVLEAARADADLLIMGAFGHSRLREFVFGGFTQHVLDGVDLPVLLFH